MIELGYFPTMTRRYLTTGGLPMSLFDQAAKIDAQVVPCGAYRAAAMVPKRLTQDAKEIMKITLW